VPAALVPPGVVTVTSTVPEPAGELAVHEVDVQVEMIWTTVLDPNATVPPARFDPVTVTAVPPAAGPLFGLKPVTTGAGGGGGVEDGVYTSPPDR
jgi:hypothetical protein